MAALVITLAPISVQAVEPNQVADLTVEQGQGYATLRWAPVDGATDYQIERTVVNSDGTLGAAVITGVWTAPRQIPTYQPAFADSGFDPGLRLQWRVRARFGTTSPQPYSEPIIAQTLPQWGDPSVPGENLRTQWETTLAASFTGNALPFESSSEGIYTAALDAASERVRVVSVGNTIQGRPLNLFIIQLTAAEAATHGYPAPPQTAAEIAAQGPALVNCNVHGNEPSSREACFIMARELAFSQDPRIVNILGQTTVLLFPSINGDGRNSNARGNSTGRDLNRAHSILDQPETFAFSELLRDYQPRAAFDGHEFGNNSAGDLPVLPPRHQNVGQSIFDQSQDMIVNWLYEHGSNDGWWYCPYGCQGGGSVGLSEETILRNAMGLKNTAGSLLEARSGGGTTRPNEGSAQNNRRRKTYSALYTYHQFLDYYTANRAAIETARNTAIEFQISNTGRIVFRGSRPIPGFPAPHPGQAPPPADAPTAANILNDPPCGYLLTAAQYDSTPVIAQAPPVAFRTTVGERMDAHGWSYDTRQTGYIVRMAQPQRGLIPLLLDAQAAEEWLSAQRLYECPYVIASSTGFDAATIEGTTTTGSLAIANIAVEPNQPLNWTITEAETDCSSPSDLDWVSAADPSGSTASSGSTDVEITFDATNYLAPTLLTGVLCLTSNDAGEPLISFPISLQVQYPFGGFQPPIGGELNLVTAGQNIPVKFDVGGERTSAVLADGYPVSTQVDCTTFEPLGSPEATNSSTGLYWSDGKYQYDWKTLRAWRGTCRELNVTLDDGTSWTAVFRFQ